MKLGETPSRSCVCSSETLLHNKPIIMQLLLDASMLPEVISAVQYHRAQVLEHIFSVTRTWTYVTQRERLKLLGRWNTFSSNY